MKTENEEIKEEQTIENTQEDTNETAEAVQETEQVVEVDQEESTETAVDLAQVDDQVSQLLADKEALEERVLRLQAEIANMQRSNQRERQDAAKYRSQSLAKELLDGMDNLERALNTEITSEDGLALKQGVEMVLKQFQQGFANENITLIDPMGEAFDPNFHQAVSIMPGEEGQATHTVIQVLQKGYLLNDRVIRPAMVIVAE